MKNPSKRFPSIDDILHQRYNVVGRTRTYDSPNNQFSENFALDSKLLVSNQILTSTTKFYSRIGYEPIVSK